MEKTLWIIKSNIINALIIETVTPKVLVSFSGRSLKLKIPSEANLSNFLKICQNNYNLDIDSYSSIQFNVLPLPNLSIKNVKFRLKKKPIDLERKPYI